MKNSKKNDEEDDIADIEREALTYHQLQDFLYDISHDFNEAFESAPRVPRPLHEYTALPYIEDTKDKSDKEDTKDKSKRMKRPYQYISIENMMVEAECAAPSHTLIENPSMNRHMRMLVRLRLIFLKSREYANIFEILHNQNRFRMLLIKRFSSLATAVIPILLLLVKDSPGITLSCAGLAVFVASLNTWASFVGFEANANGCHTAKVAFDKIGNNIKNVFVTLNPTVKDKVEKDLLFETKGVKLKLPDPRSAVDIMLRRFTKNMNCIDNIMSSYFQETPEGINEAVTAAIIYNRWRDQKEKNDMEINYDKTDEERRVFNDSIIMVFNQLVPSDSKNWHDLSRILHVLVDFPSDSENDLSIILHVLVDLSLNDSKTGDGALKEKIEEIEKKKEEIDLLKNHNELKEFCEKFKSNGSEESNNELMNECTPILLKVAKNIYDIRQRDQGEKTPKGEDKPLNMSSPSNFLRRMLDEKQLTKGISEEEFDILIKTLLPADIVAIKEELPNALQKIVKKKTLEGKFEVEFENEATKKKIKIIKLGNVNININDESSKALNSKQLSELLKPFFEKGNKSSSTTSPLNNKNIEYVLGIIKLVEKIKKENKEREIGFDEFIEDIKKNPFWYIEKLASDDTKQYFEAFLKFIISHMSENQLNYIKKYREILKKLLDRDLSEVDKNDTIQEIFAIILSYIPKKVIRIFQKILETAVGIHYAYETLRDIQNFADYSGRLERIKELCEKEIEELSNDDLKQFQENVESDKKIKKVKVGNFDDLIDIIEDKIVIMIEEGQLEILKKDGSVQVRVPATTEEEPHTPEKNRKKIDWKNVKDWTKALRDVCDKSKGIHDKMDKIFKALEHIICLTEENNEKEYDKLVESDLKSIQEQVDDIDNLIEHIKKLNSDDLVSKLDEFFKPSEEEIAEGKRHRNADLNHLKEKAFKYLSEILAVEKVLKTAFKSVDFVVLGAMINPFVVLKKKADKKKADCIDQTKIVLTMEKIGSHALTSATLNLKPGVDFETKKSVISCQGLIKMIQKDDVKYRNHRNLIQLTCSFPVFLLCHSRNEDCKKLWNQLVLNEKESVLFDKIKVFVLNCYKDFSSSKEKSLKTTVASKTMKVGIELLPPRAVNLVVTAVILHDRFKEKQINLEKDNKITTLLEIVFPKKPDLQEISKNNQTLKDLGIELRDSSIIAFLRDTFFQGRAKEILIILGDLYKNFQLEEINQPHKLIKKLINNPTDFSTELFNLCFGDKFGGDITNYIMEKVTEVPEKFVDDAFGVIRDTSRKIRRRFTGKPSNNSILPQATKANDKSVETVNVSLQATKANDKSVETVNVSLQKLLNKASEKSMLFELWSIELSWVNSAFGTITLMLSVVTSLILFRDDYPHTAAYTAAAATVVNTVSDVLRIAETMSASHRYSNLFRSIAQQCTYYLLIGVDDQDSMYEDLNNQYEKLERQIKRDKYIVPPPAYFNDESKNKIFKIIIEQEEPKVEWFYMDFIKNVPLTMKILLLPTCIFLDIIKTILVVVTTSPVAAGKVVDEASKGESKKLSKDAVSKDFDKEGFIDEISYNELQQLSLKDRTDNIEGQFNAAVQAMPPIPRPIGKNMMNKYKYITIKALMHEPKIIAPAYSNNKDVDYSDSDSERRLKLLHTLYCKSTEYQAIHRELGHDIKSKLTVIQILCLILSTFNTMMLLTYNGENKRVFGGIIAAIVSGIVSWTKFVDYESRSAGHELSFKRFASISILIEGIFIPLKDKTEKFRKDAIFEALDRIAHEEMLDLDEEIMKRDDVGSGNK